jgi:hypothetical protein
VEKNFIKMHSKFNFNNEIAILLFRIFIKQLKLVEGDVMIYKNQKKKVIQPEEKVMLN